MQAMLIEDDPAARAGAAAALSRAGFEVTVAGSVDAAKAAVRRGLVDVLVMAERVGGRLAHDVALLAELRNPDLGTILLSDRSADEADEIFALLPSLHAVLGRRTPPRMLTDLARAIAQWQGQEVPSMSARPDPAPVAHQGVGRVPPLELRRSAIQVATAPDVVPPEPLAQCPSPIEAALDPSAMTSAASPARAMPPYLPAPNRLPSFLRMAGLTSAQDAEAVPMPPAALPGKASARRLHLA